MFDRKRIFAVIIVIVLLSAGCRYDRGFLSLNIEKERQAFATRYKAERENILNREYAGDNHLERESAQCADLLDLMINTYNNVLRWRTSRSLTAEEKSSVDAIKRECNLWVSKVYKVYEDVTGSYSGIGEYYCLMTFYDMALRRLLMSQVEAERWRRIENLTWEFSGKKIVFSSGIANVKVQCNLFEEPISSWDYYQRWMALIDEEFVFSLNGFDYAIVRFADEEIREGIPTVTKELALVEINDGKVSRCIGLHFISDFEMVLLGDRNQVVIRAADGEVKFVIDLHKMKIIRQLSLLPSFFDIDGYGEIFTDEWVEGK